VGISKLSRRTWWLLSTSFNLLLLI